MCEHFPMLSTVYFLSSKDRIIISWDQVLKRFWKLIMDVDPED